MLETINSDLNMETAVIYANNKIETEDTDLNYNEEEYVLITDPIRRIADMKY